MFIRFQFGNEKVGGLIPVPLFDFFAQNLSISLAFGSFELDIDSIVQREG
jgi:hypothetical protein